MNQFNRQLGLELRDAAIASVEEAAAVDWKEAAISALQKVCRIFHEFTVDDVQREIALSGATTHEERAMGAMMRRGVREGWMEYAGRHTRSGRSQSHCGPRAVWRSKLK